MYSSRMFLLNIFNPKVIVYKNEFHLFRNKSNRIVVDRKKNRSHKFLILRTKKKINETICHQKQ